MSRRPARAGFAVAEALVGLLLGLLLLQVALRSLAAVRAVSRIHAMESDGLDATRVVWMALGGELARGERGRDWTVRPDGSVTVRAFRAVALPCPAGSRAGARELAVVRIGTRRPDPRKDSVLLIRDDGTTDVQALVARRATATPGCRWAGAGGVSERWVLEAPPTEPPVLLRLFETGRYSVANGALRYGRGRGGRQPLTPQVLDAGASTFVEGGVGVEVELKGNGPARWRWQGLLGGPR